jgi:hypothetical protein
MPVVSWGLLFLLPAHAVACRIAALYRGIWMFASLPDLKRVLSAVGCLPQHYWYFFAFYRYESGWSRVPCSNALSDADDPLYGRWSGGVPDVERASPLWWLDCPGQAGGDCWRRTRRGHVARELERSADWRVVCLVDDDRSKWGRELSGNPIVGGDRQLCRTYWLPRKATHVILAMPSAAAETCRPGDRSRRRSRGARVYGAGLEDVMGGRVAISSIRPVEIEDLLGREPVWIDTRHVAAMVAGKTVLVTGAGGSIGSELCRQLARFSPAQLVLYEQSEFALYTLEQWFSVHMPETLAPIALAGDVKDAERLNEVFAAYRPQVVFHAAAYKHVPLMEVGQCLAGGA